MNRILPSRYVDGEDLYKGRDDEWELIVLNHNMLIKEAKLLTPTSEDMQRRYL